MKFRVMVACAAFVFTAAARGEQVLVPASAFLANPAFTVIDLKEDNGRSIGRVDRPSVQRLVDVATRVAAAYGFGAPHPVITMTTSPDAYAVWYTDGLRVEINPLMLELVGGNDDTLAALVAHVLAHTRDRSYSNNPQQREMEADQKALRAMADAGFNLQGAALFWQTMQAHPRAVWNDSHPSYPERAKVLAAAVAAAHH